MVLVLLLQSARDLTTEDMHFLSAKICRRMVKLERLRENAKHPEAVENLFSALSPRIRSIVSETRRRIESLWEQFKRQTTKQIPHLEKYASPDQQQLTLKFPGQHFRDIRERTQQMLSGRRPRWKPPRDSNPSFSLNQKFIEFTRTIIRTAEGEEKVVGNTDGDLSIRIRRLLDTGVSVYQGHARKMSLLILNALEFWMTLDEDTCRQYPLPHEYHPLFSPEMLEFLQLTTYRDMLRAQQIEEYLTWRLEQCNGTTRKSFTIAVFPVLHAGSTAIHLLRLQCMLYEEQSRWTLSAR